MIDYYTLLNLSPEADQSTILSSLENFKKKINHYGPGIELTDEDFIRQFPEINEGYTVLLDPELRTQYNKLLGRTRESSTESTFQDADVDIPPTVNSTLMTLLTYAGFTLVFLAILYGFSLFFAL